MQTLQQTTGVTIAWVQCLCGAAGAFLLGSASLADAVWHVETAHPGQDPLRLLEARTDDAAVTRNTRGLDRDNPAPWLKELNGALPADF
ncbi:hypothetical protein ACIRQY_34040 [Streptomyces sp. NPDC101490]|uniref:hypothetical protein n=1 Tax=Streptomyces sp. NPDC101490 TaxID=3366143 RepID=UPI0038199D88